MEDDSPGGEDSAPDIDEVYASDLRYTQSGSFEVVVPEELIQYHDLSDGVTFSIVPLWAGAHRPTTIGLEARPREDTHDGEVPSASEVGSSNRTWNLDRQNRRLRLPKALLVDRGFSPEGGPDSRDTLYLRSPAPGRLQIQFNVPTLNLPSLSPAADPTMIDPLFDPAEETSESVHRVTYSVPEAYRSLFDLDESGSGIGSWSVGLHSDQPVLVLQLRPDDAGESELGPLETTYRSGRLTIPGQLIELLPWTAHPVRVVPEADRLVFMPVVTE